MGHEGADGATQGVRRRALQIADAGDGLPEPGADVVGPQPGPGAGREDRVIQTAPGRTPASRLKDVDHGRRENQGPIVAALTRQDGTKSGHDRTLILPAAVIDALTARRTRTAWQRLDDPVFASRLGTWLWPHNIRTRLRQAVSGISDLEGTTPHTLRRTVGTLVAHEAGLDATREQLGHSDPSVTYQRYVAARRIAPDLRPVLDQFFLTKDASDPEDDAPRPGSSGSFTGVSTESTRTGEKQKAPDPHLCRSGASGGAACQNRTDDLIITSDSLYRLS